MLTEADIGDTIDSRGYTIKTRLHGSVVNGVEYFDLQERWFPAGELDKPPTVVLSVPLAAEEITPGMRARVIWKKA